MLPLTPTRLGRYEILDEIGKGAMGVVYLAKDPLIGRLVALKTFRSVFSIRDQELEQFRARFIREAQSAGILSHPNIVTIHDVVEDSGEGLSFIAMEYVRGTNLKMVLQGEHPLPFSRVADIVAQIAEALDYAHSQRVIHRDVKPANVILTEDGRVKITDFGIARLDTSNLTQEGQLLGTPNYMAPEQVQGKEVDHRADIFALGVVLYEMLTRHKPFQGENLTVVSHRIVYDHFTPLRDYAKNLPPGVEKIISKALEKDPNRRYQRARELADDLKKVAAEIGGDDLNETQSLSETLVLPAAAAPLPAAPAAAAQAAAKPPLWNRLRGRFGAGTDKPPLPAPPAPPAPSAVASAPVVPLVRPGAAAAAGDATSGSGTGSVALAPPAEPPPLPPVAAVPPPPPQPVPASAAAADGTAGEATGTEGSLSAALPQPVPRPPQPAAGRRSPGRLALAVGLIAALGVAGIFLLWAVNSRRPAAPPPKPAAPQAASPEQVARLLEEGHRRMRRGEFQEAAALYRNAESLYSHPDITRLREAAERLGAELQQMVGQEQDIAARREAARKALTEKRYPDAIAAAQAVLAARPEDADAKDILGKAQARLKLQEARTASQGVQRRPESTPAAEQLTPAPSPAVAETASPAAPQTAKVQFVLHVDAGAAEGAVRVLRDTERLWSQPFDVGGGFLKRNRGRDFNSDRIEVPAGRSQLWVIYAPKSLEVDGAKKKVVFDIQGGETRRFDIRITRARDVIVEPR